MEGIIKVRSIMRASSPSLNFPPSLLSPSKKLPREQEALQVRRLREELQGPHPRPHAHPRGGQGGEAVRLRAVRRPLQPTVAAHRSHACSHRRATVSSSAVRGGRNRSQGRLDNERIRKEGARPRAQTQVLRSAPDGQQSRNYLYLCVTLYLPCCPALYI